MAKRNYSAWNINAQTIDSSLPDSEKLIRIAEYAILAPSGHNSQPWQLTIDGDGLLVAIHPDHHLAGGASALLGVEPYISIGAFLEAFGLAGAGFGYSVNIKLFPTEKHIARIGIASMAKAKPELLTAIKLRVSNRHNFTQNPVAPNILKGLTGSELPGVETTIISSREDIAFIADQTETAIGAIMSDPLYRHELSEWVRTNQTRKYDGMPGFTHGFGTAKSLLSKIAVKHAKGQGPQAAKSAELIQNSGALIITRCSSEEKASFVNAGRMYARICILAQAAGYATSALGASVIDPQTRKVVSSHFKIDDRPIYIIRIGHAAKTARHSPRWPLEKLMKS